MLRYLLVPLFFVFTLAHAEDEVLSSYSVTSPSAETLKALNVHFDLEHWRGNSVEIVVPQSQIKTLLSIAPQARLVESDTAAAAQAKLLLYSMSSLFSPQGYHSIEEVQTWMRGIESQHPQMAKVIQYGTSGAGRALLAIRINKSAQTKPVLMITAATHGDERITTEILMSLIDQLIAGNGTNPRFTAMLDNYDLYFVPVVNVDGFANTRRHDGNYDPNRSYPWPGEDNLPTPSIAGMIQLYNTIQPVGTLDFHAYGELVMYPWAYTYDELEPTFRTPFVQLTSAMAAHNNYSHGQISNILYVAKGSSSDYYFWKSKAISVVIEVGSEKIPDPSEIPDYTSAQAESVWTFIESF